MPKKTADQEASDARAAFAKRVTDAVTAYGSANKLARDIDVAQSSVWKWMQGKTDPSRDNMIRLARVLEVRLEWLTTGAGAMRETPAAERDHTWACRIELRRLIPKLNDWQHLPDRLGVTQATMLSWYQKDGPLPSEEQIAAIEREAAAQGKPTMIPRPLRAGSAATPATGRPDTDVMSMPTSDRGRLEFQKAAWFWLDGVTEAVIREVTDDAMAPTLRPGDRILVDRTIRDVPNGEGLFLYALDPTQVRRAVMKGGQLVAVKDNAKSNAADVPPGTKVIGRVVAVLRKL